MVDPSVRRLSRPVAERLMAGCGALGLRRGQVLSQQGRRGVQYAVIGGFGTKHSALIYGIIGGEGRKEDG